MNAIDRAVRIMTEYAAKFDGWIDRAALGGDDANAKRLIYRKIKVNAFINQLQNLKNTVEEGVVSSQAIGQLNGLADAIGACVNMSNSNPNFKKIGKDINKLFSGIEDAQDQISKLTEALTPDLEEDIELDPRLATPQKPKFSFEESPEFKTEYAKMLERIAPNVGSTPDIADKVADAPTGNLDIDGLIKKINEETEE